MLTTTTQPRAHRLFASVPYLLSSLVSHRHLLRNPLSCNILSCDLFLSTAMAPRQPRRQPPCTTRTVTGDPKSSPLSTIPSDSPSLGVANVTGSRVAISQQTVYHWLRPDCALHTFQSSSVVTDAAVQFLY
ncbi:hypothetical protein HBI56_005150 [Parastagonospora nodorum]|nr:hypothetical protein HBH53_079300 [Parastagonospora nodorum]KAH4124063.1 hypothetical protein HBH47_071710 [Parastagonospora nodorum]KAH4249487.1 hypothetical protein HBI05_005920 [Parastagonospora nodorum]KAH4274783.1 hypothetical protein HBI03_014710 [Parastagonospora nodorum]KAH4283983.1 hypothetical protein HBI04_005240 [Parastagonospora nodorum]